MSDYTPSLTEDQREAVLDWMELPSKPQVYEAVARMIVQVRAETLREAYADVQAYTDSGAPFGHRPVEEFLLRRADRIEREAGLK